MTLTDVYCLFNRARGTELVSPDDLLNACQLFDQFDSRMKLRRFDSGVVVRTTWLDYLFFIVLVSA